MPSDMVFYLPGLNISCKDKGGNPRKAWVFPFSLKMKVMVGTGN
jgi:hypothetical protein